jgi:hypothetical protein
MVWKWSEIIECQLYPSYRGPITDNIGGIRFHNLRDGPETDRSLGEVLR